MHHTELEKLTQEFCGKEKIRMAEALGLPYRTYQDYVYGKRKIPRHVAQKALDLILADRAYMAGMVGRIDSRIDAEFPHGIPSEGL